MGGERVKARAEKGMSATKGGTPASKINNQAKRCASAFLACTVHWDIVESLSL